MNILSKIKEMTFIKNKKLTDQQLELIICSSVFSNSDITQDTIETHINNITDGPKDMGIDLIVERDEPDNSKTIYFIQHTSTKSEVNKKIISNIEDMQKAVFTFSKYENILNSKVKARLEDVMNRPKQEKINYRFEVVADVKKEKIEQSTWDHIKALNNNSKKGVRFNIWTNDKYNFFKVTRFIKGVDVDEFVVKKPAMVLYNNESELSKVTNRDTEAYIGYVKATALVRNYNKHGKGLFEKNVRHFLGENNKVNKGIVKTIENNDSDKFFKYNNGITVVANSYDEGFANSDSIWLWDAQIINGAQTTSSLSTIDTKKLDNVFVPIKIIIETSNKEIANIAKYSNSQSSISQRDLLSNTKTQVDLQGHFLENGILLEVKRNEFSKNKFYKLYKNSTNEIVAQFFLSTFIGRPNDAKNKKKHIFDTDKDIYSEIFVNTSFDNMFIAYKIGDYVTNFINTQSSNSKYFDHILAKFIFMRLSETSLDAKNIDKKILGLKNIPMEKIFKNIKEHLRQKHINSDGEIKTDREISISSKLHDLIEAYYETISWT